MGELEGEVNIIKVSIWITKKCNLACNYCYEGIEKETISMNEELVDDVIQFLLKLNFPLSIRFHGGEPLLKFELIKYFIDSMRKKNFRNVKVDYHITTNGLIATEDIVKYLKDNISDISLSIDGGKTVNDLNRHTMLGKGSYDILEKKCAMFLKYHPDTRARMTFTSETVKSLFDSVKHVVNLGFKVIAVAPDQFDKRWKFEQAEILAEQIKKISEKFKNFDNLHIGLIDKSVFCRYADCSGGTDEISIGADGKVYPCGFSVDNSNFLIGDIWDGINVAKVKELQSYSRITNPDCVGCTMIPFCTGNRCKIINKLVTDDYYVPPTATCIHQNVKVETYSYMK